MTKKQIKERTQTIDLNFIRNPIEVALRRVSAIYCIGRIGVTEWTGESFELQAIATHKYWPDSLGQSTIKETKREYEIWLINTCLKELDQFFSIFLDRVWEALKLIELHETVVKGPLPVDLKFNDRTNVGAKYRDICQNLLIEGHSDCFASLSKARNCLSHNMGQVRSPRDCNIDDRKSLEVSWIGFDHFVESERRKIKMETPAFDLHQFPNTERAQLRIITELTTRTKAFSAGSFLNFSEAEMSEISFFHKIASDEIMKALKIKMDQKGIQLSPKASTPS